MKHIISTKTGNALRQIVDIINKANDGDIIVVANEDQRILTQRAVNRMNIRLTVELATTEDTTTDYLDVLDTDGEPVLDDTDLFRIAARAAITVLADSWQYAPDIERNDLVEDIDEVCQVMATYKARLLGQDAPEPDPILGGIAIIKKYDPGADFAAEHDVIYFGAYESRTLMTPAEKKQMEKWNWHEEYDSWAHFV